jgi:polyisoprenoid-binding protein YceI
MTMTTRTTWTIDPAHTNVEFAVRHLMISTVKGRFGDVKGTVALDLANPAAAQVDVTIGATSIDTRNSDRDAHLRSADFFDVEKFPELRYVSRKVDVLPDGTFRVVGDLTIRGVSREVSLAATLEGTGADPWGGHRAGFSATGKINRGDFGLTWNKAIETGGVVVGDEVRLIIEAELVQAAAKAAA